MELSEAMSTAANSFAPDTLTQLARHAHPDVRCRVANNPAVPPTALRALVETGLHNVGRGSSGTNASIDYRKEADILQEVGTHRDTPEDALDMLAREHGTLQEAVASNERSPGEVLHSLVNDYHDTASDVWTVELTVASHANTFPSTLDLLATEVQRTYTDEELAELMRSSDFSEGFVGPSHVLLAIAAHPSAPAATRDGIRGRIASAMGMLGNTDRRHVAADTQSMLEHHAGGSHAQALINWLPTSL